MSNTDYSALDDAICDHIKHGVGHPTNSMRLENIARTLTTGSVPWRLIDRRMQAMRKAGRLIYGIKPTGKKGWMVAVGR